MTKIILLFLFLQTLLLPAQNTIFVNQNVQGGQQNGITWADAFPNLQQALAIAKTDDAIWVAKGTYNPTASTNRNISFQLISGTRLYGGFDGSETILQQRDIIANPTVLSGEIGDPNLRSDNSYHVVRGKGLANSTIVDGFYITQGYSYGEFTPATLDGMGAGMLLEGSAEQANSRPNIFNCTFEQNACSAGGALCTSWADPDNPVGEYLVNPVLRNCTFDRNRAFYYGGAFYVNSPSGEGDTLEIKDCSFTGNYVYIYGGGGLYFNQTANTNVRLTACLFERDSAPQGALGGAIYFGANQPDQTMAALVMDSCIFRKNIASEGAGLYYAGGFNFLPTKIDFFCQMRSCLFESNKTTNGGSGSAYSIGSSIGGGISVKIKECVFKDNLAGNFTTTVGLSGQSESDVLMENCVFINNLDVDNPKEICLAIQSGASDETNISHVVHTRINNCLFAKNGGGVAALVGNRTNGSTEINNCTFFDNSEYIFVKNKISPNPEGFQNDMYLNNCVVWEPNTDGIKMFYNNNPNVYEMYGFHVENTMTTVPSGFWQWPGAQTVFGDNMIINEYPKFVDTLANNFRLLPCSPAVDAGNNSIVSTFEISNDLDGNPRIYRDTVDLGAYETQDSCFIISSQEPTKTFENASISPNPTYPGGTLNVQVEGLAQSIFEWRIFDAYGRNLASNRAVLSQKNTLTLEAPKVPSLYFLEIKAGARLACLKFVVQ